MTTPKTTIADAISYARRRYEDCYLVEMDHEDTRRVYVVPTDYVGTDEFAAFDGRLIAYVEKTGEVEYL